MLKPDPVVALRALATACLCFGTGRSRIADRLVEALIEEYFQQIHERRDPRDFQQALRRAGIQPAARHLRWLEFCAEECLGAADRVIQDFSRILRLPAGVTLFHDPAKRVRTALSLTRDRPGLAYRYYCVQRALRGQMRAFVSAVESELGANLQSAVRTREWNEQLRAVYDALEETCPEAVERTVRRIGRPGFHHICRKKVGGGKPESLNTAYFHVLKENPLALGEPGHVVVIDADSLLPTSSLTVMAAEIRNDSDRNVIRQVAPLSTSNYAGNNIFVKMISCLDTIGSMGKWARNTRTLSRVDLPAGSGLVIPTMLLEYLRQTKGAPWEARTITEDARLVITDFGLMDGVSRKTKFVPIHMVEAVPEAQSLWQVFKQYWVQRMRWASGGPDEVLEILRAFRDDRSTWKATGMTGPLCHGGPVWRDGFRSAGASFAYC